MKDSSESKTAINAPDSAPLLLTVQEASSALRISRWSLYQLINNRRLKSVRIKNRRLIALVDLSALIEELREEGGADGH